MTRLNLYMILHGNLNFSSIPKDQYAIVLDNCYWPMIDLIEQGYKMAIEFPASTLLELSKIDKSFINKITELWSANKCDVLTSGFTQSIMPLIPYEVNIKNLSYGLNTYEKILKRKPEICFLPEQTISKNLFKIFHQSGFKALVMDWDNASEYQSYEKEQRYNPAFLKNNLNLKIPIIWNSSMNSFKFQRYIYGRISITDYIEGIKHHLHPKKERSLCIYGTDWEIFNFRPLTHEVFDNEVNRVKTLFEFISKQNKINFILPSDLIKKTDNAKAINITSSQIPIPCKNRDDYNVIRWAVSGRDNCLQNTKCHQVLNLLEKLDFSDTKKNNSSYWQQLIELWGSDYRTKTTSEKHYSFWTNIGNLEHTLKKHLFHCKSKKHGNDLIIKNCSNKNITNTIQEVELKFKEKQYFHQIGLTINAKEVPSQCENIMYYKDGSIRQLLLVFEINIQAKEVLHGKFIKKPKNLNPNYMLKISGSEISVKTSNVEFTTNTNTGADIRSLIFPKVSESALVKYLPPVYFDNIAYGNDYFSGWSQICTDAHKIIHDTTPTDFTPDQNQFMIRIPLHFKQNFHNGFLIKRYDIYMNQNRLDITNHFYFPLISPIFFRSGITTINPQAFNLDSLQFSTQNGSQTHESYNFKGTNINHTQFPTHQTSATSCLGSTNGWISIHDDQTALSMITDKSILYSVPMLEFKELKKSYLLRINHSIAESDDTGQLTFYGHNKFKLTYLAHKTTKNFSPPSIETNSHPLVIYQT